MNKIKKYLGSTALMLSVLVFGFGSNFAEAVTYTSSDVASHNTASDCWVIINGNVYNLTSFIPLHPGGQAVIIGQCGKDGTATFNSGPHPAGTLNAINSSIIGTLGTSTQNPILTTLMVTPAAPSIMVGGTQQLAASTKDQNNTSIAATLSFASSNTAVATVDSSTGLVTGVALGSATITTTAVNGSVTLSATNVVTVTNVAPTPVLTSVTISPSVSSIVMGGTSQLTASPKDQNGNAFIGATNTFTSSDPSVATVDSSTGLVSGVAAGTTTITVTSVSGNMTITGTSSITVNTVVTTGGGDDSDKEEMNHENDNNREEMNHENNNDHYSDNRSENSSNRHNSERSNGDHVRGNDRNND